MTRNTHPEANPHDPASHHPLEPAAAAVRGTNDGIVSVGSLVVGVVGGRWGRVLPWGAFTMAVTSGIGHLLGTVV